MADEVRSAVGAPDILVNNTGIVASGMRLVDFLETRPEDWGELLSRNLGAVLSTTHAVATPLLNLAAKKR